MMWLSFVTLVISVISASAVQETNHFVQVDKDSRQVSMDITTDSTKNTDLIVIGDVSMYKDGLQTVNLHDYNTVYAVLKIVNDGICLLERAPLPKATPEKYRLGLARARDVHGFTLDINSTRLTNDQVFTIAGPNIASFCNTYSTYFMTATPEQRPATAVPDTLKFVKQSQRTSWCIFSTWRLNSTQYQELLTVI